MGELTPTGTTSDSAGIFIFGDLHLGKKKAPSLEWAKQSMAGACELGATVCVCAGDLIHRKLAADDPAHDQAFELMSYAVELFDEVHFIGGNHDVHAEIPLPVGVVKHSTQPHEFECAGAIVHTAAVATDPDPREVKFPVLENVDKRIPHVAILHSSATGEFSKKPCLPISLEQMLSCGYDAWILAHVHTPHMLHENPFIGWVGMESGIIYRPGSGEIIRLD